MLSKELKELLQKQSDYRNVHGDNFVTIEHLLEHKDEIKSICKTADKTTLPMVEKPSDIYVAIKKLQTRPKKLQAWYLLYLIEKADNAMDAVILDEVQGHDGVSIWERAI